MVNPQESLKILSNYNDFGAYQTLYNQKVLKKEEKKDSFEFPAAFPKGHHETEFTTMLLKKLLFQVSVAMKFESVSLRYYKEFGHHFNLKNILADYKVPNYLPYIKLLLEEEKNFASKFKDLIEEGYTTLTKGNALEVLDFVGVFLLTLHSEEYQI